MTGLYGVKKDPRSNDWCVYLKRTRETYFFGTKEECQEWVERNDGDEWR